MTLTENIRRALTAEARVDIQPLLRLRSFTEVVALRLSDRSLSLTDLAGRIGRPRNSVSLVVHRKRHIPSVELAIRKELGL